MGNGNSKKSRKSQVFEIINESDTTNSEATNQITVTEVEKVLGVVSSENAVTLKTEPPDLIEETTDKTKTIPDKQEEQSSENKTTDIVKDGDKSTITTENSTNGSMPGKNSTIPSDVPKESVEENVSGQNDSTESNDPITTVIIDTTADTNAEMDDDTVHSRDNDKKMSMKIKEKKKSKKEKNPKEEKESKKKVRLSKKEKKSIKKNSKKEEKQTNESEIVEAQTEVNYMPCQENTERTAIGKNEKAEFQIVAQNTEAVENEGGEKIVVSSELSIDGIQSESTLENSQFQDLNKQKENVTSVESLVNRETTCENEAISRQLTISKEPNSMSDSSTAENLKLITNMNADEHNQNYLQEAFDLIDAAKSSIPTFDSKRNTSVPNDESYIQLQTKDSLGVQTEISKIHVIPDESVNVETNEEENIVTKETQVMTSLSQPGDNFNKGSHPPFSDHVSFPDVTITVENGNNNSSTLVKNDAVNSEIPLNTESLETAVAEKNENIHSEIAESTITMSPTALTDSDDLKIATIVTTEIDVNESPNQTLQTGPENVIKITEGIDSVAVLGEIEVETTPDKSEDQSQKKDKEKKKKKEKEKKQKSMKEKKKTKNGESNDVEIQAKDVASEDTTDTVHNLIKKFEDQNTKKKKDKFIIKKKKSKAEETDGNQTNDETVISGEKKVITTKSPSKSDDVKKSKKKKKDKKNKCAVLENSTEISSPVKSIFDDVPAEIEVNHEDVVSLSSLSSDEKETPKSTSEGQTIDIRITSDTLSEETSLENTTINPNLLGVDPSQTCSRPNSDEYVTLFVNEDDNTENEAENGASNISGKECIEESSAANSGQNLVQPDAINEDNIAVEKEAKNDEKQTKDNENCVQDIPESGNSVQDSVTDSVNNEHAQPNVDDNGLKSDTMEDTVNSTDEADPSRLNISSENNGDQTSTPESPISGDNIKSSPKKKSKKASKKKDSKTKSIFRHSSDVSNIEKDISTQQVSFDQDPKEYSPKERRRSFSEFLRPVFGNIFSKSSSTSPSKKKDKKEVTTPDEEEATKIETQNS